MHENKILLVEDEVHVREVMSRFLQSRRYEVLTAGTCAEAERLCQSGRPDLGVLDYGLPGGNALCLIPKLKSIAPTIPVIVTTGYGSVDLAVQAVRLGPTIF